MSEVLLGPSYYLRFDPKLWEAQQPYPPLGTLYAASYLRQRGYDVAVFDAVLAESEVEWEQAINRHRPRIAVLYEDNFNYLSKMCLLRMRQAAFAMIGMARRHNCTIIVSGADATDHPGMYLERGADFVLLGEGEITLGELLDRLTGRTHLPIEMIAGLAFRKGLTDALQNPGGREASDGALIITPPRAFIRELDALPFPAWDLIDVERYRQLWYQRHGYFSMNVVTTRGCPFHCNWCAKPIWGQRYHSRSPENVVSELAFLAETYSPDHIWIMDDIFGLKPGWVARFADLMQAEGLRLPFKSLNRADLLLREGEIEALRRAGCHTVWIGAESGSQKILDAMDKGTRVEQIREVARRLHRAGIRVGFFLQFGYPGERRGDIEQTIHMVRESRPDDIGMSVAYPLPGTRFYQAVEAQLGVRQNWVDSSDMAMLYQGPFSTAFYRQLHTVLHKEFRMRCAWWRLTGQAIQPCNPIHSRLKGRKGILKACATLIYLTLTLPISRWKMERLARQPHRETGTLPRQLSPEEASRPSPQPE